MRALAAVAIGLVFGGLISALDIAMLPEPEVQHDVCIVTFSQENSTKTYWTCVGNMRVRIGTGNPWR